MAKINIHPVVEEIKLSDFRPAPYNPRKIEERAYVGLRHSMEKFGYVGLVLVNRRTGHIVGGHQRWKVLQEEGVETVKAIVVDVDDATERQMNLELNNPEICGDFTAAVIPLLEDIRKNFPQDYLDLQLKAMQDSLGDMGLDNAGMGKTLPDDIPAPPEPMTKLGDLWILGDHRLLCGDSTNIEHVARLMDGHKAKLMATDPPYLVDYTGANRPSGGKDWSDVYHEIDITDAKGFLKGFLSVGLANIDENSAIYMWHADRRFVLISEIFNELNLLMHQHIIWVKPNSVQTHSVYPWRHEPCIFGWHKGNKPFYRPPPEQTASVWYVNLMRRGDPDSPAYYSDLWEVDWEGKKRNNGLLHPTVKPTEIFAIPMRIHTTPGDICYEPFSGSGSQIIAGERVTRRVFAMEIEPVFCDVAVRRWEEFTGKKAVKA